MLVIVQRVCGQQMKWQSAEQVEDLVSEFLVVQWTRHLALVRKLVQHLGPLHLVLSSSSLEPPLGSSDVNEMMEQAAASDSLDALQALVTYTARVYPMTRQRWLTTKALDAAVKLGHGRVRVIEWLLEDRRAQPPSTQRSLALAAGHGHLEIVQWLCDRQLHEETQIALENAAAAGHLEIVQFLWHTVMQTMDCIQCVVEQAVFGGHFAVVKWLEHLSNKHNIPQEHTQNGSCSSHVIHDESDHGGVEKLTNQTFMRLLEEKDNISHWLETAKAKMVPDRHLENAGPYTIGECRRAPSMTEEAVAHNQSLVRHLVEKGRMQAYEWLVNRNPRVDLFRWFALGACMGGDADLLEWLVSKRVGDNNDEHDTSELFQACLNVALRNGHLAVVEFWLHNGVLPESLVEAVSNGHVEMVTLLLDKYEGEKWCIPEGVQCAARNGHIQMVKWLDPGITENYSKECVYSAARSGNVAMLELLSSKHREMLTWERALALAVQAGQVEAVKFTYQQVIITQDPRWISTIQDAISTRMRQHTKTGLLKDLTWSLESAACAGHFEVIKFLLANESPRHCFLHAVIEEAARKRQYELIQLLHEKDAHPFNNAMDHAAFAGSLRIVKFLHENRRQSCTTKAMDFASANGYLSVVRFLHENRREGCTTQAMDYAATYGHLNVVRFLHEKRSEGCTTKAMYGACINGHLTVVRFLHEKRREGCSSDTIAKAAKLDQLEAVEFLLTHRNKPGDAQMALSSASAVGNVEIVQWIVDNGFDLDLVEVLNQLSTVPEEHGHRIGARRQQVIELLTSRLSSSNTSP